MRRLLLAAGFVGLLVAPSFAEPAVTAVSSNMRRAANPYARIVQAIPANAQIDVLRCKRGWCYGSWRGIYGFIPAFSVAEAGPPAAAFAPPPPPVVVTAPVLVAPPPPVYQLGGPYVGVGWGYGWGHW